MPVKPSNVNPNLDQTIPNDPRVAPPSESSSLGEEYNASLPHHDPKADSARLIKLLHQLAAKLSDRAIQIMEVCGTHTVTAQREGVHGLLPKNVRLISGPGCPVCVTPAGYIEQAVQLSLEHGVHIATYGDMLRVPGVTMSLEDARRQGAKVSIVYSVRDALQIARKNPQQKVVFLGIGFETTTPPTAFAVKTAQAEGLSNFLVFSAHKLIIPAMQVLLDDPKLAIDGFIGPGHVSVIIGCDAYDVVASKYHRPCVIAGFDGNQMLMALVRILTQLVAGEARIQSVYRDRITDKGNVAAQQIINEVFTPADSRWRGFGTIPQSGLNLREEFTALDARYVFQLPEPQDHEPTGCLCANIVKGMNLPTDCPLFANRCTPASPLGACMVSREGACSAFYRFRNVE
jgi:hydrogenase expression/formation protein HypD